ncbi:hypothetical protein DPMN_129965 [Dreissena polymorpha]|uniref:Secreted protein n=1 Tax=Dreissena polymorpha TaxID=45954 RepID=A0A9D4H249_DREPO|nr:hypothetical protein DPMN_129965 [Dreissena polymorpha]
MPLCTVLRGKLFRRLCGAIFVLTSTYTASSYQEDPEIQILIVQAEKLYSSIFMIEVSQMLHFLTLRSNSRLLQRRKITNLPKPQRQANYC